MREIEFKRKAKHNNNWYFGYLNYSQPRKEYYILEDFASFPAPVFENTIGQYTGHKDINNIKIYEGDIIENHDYIGGVAYSEELAHYGIVYKDMKGRTFMICLCDFDNPKVIGNIHDNPELLEG